MAKFDFDFSEEKEKVGKVKEFFTDVLSFAICGAALSVVFISEEMELVKAKKKAEFKKKLKNFIPSFTETPVGKTINWTLRETQLSDEETEALYNRLK